MSTITTEKQETRPEVALTEYVPAQTESHADVWTVLTVDGWMIRSQPIQGICGSTPEPHVNSSSTPRPTMFYSKRIVESFDPAKWPYHPEEECRREWERLGK